MTHNERARVGGYRDELNGRPCQRLAYPPANRKAYDVGRRDAAAGAPAVDLLREVERFAAAYPESMWTKAERNLLPEIRALLARLDGAATP